MPKTAKKPVSAGSPTSLRWPRDGSLLTKVRDAAKKAERSLAREVVLRLQKSFEDYPQLKD